MFIDGGIEVIAELVGRAPEFLIEFFEEFLFVFVHV
jgi:hypothetical protein